MEIIELLLKLNFMIKIYIRSCHEVQMIFFSTMFYLSYVRLITFPESLNQVWSKNKEQISFGVVNVSKDLLIT